MTSTSKLPINLENLLRQRQVEGERIEYKAGWNPDAILRTLCAFANDFENLGGGYVVIGQDCDAAGMPVFPPVGLEDNQLDKIQNELLGFCNLIQPVKELDLTEGRSTGISKIIKAMAANGSPPPEFETDEDRSYFLIRLPVHEKANDGSGLMSETGSDKTAPSSEKSSEKTAPSSEKTSGDTAEKIVRLIQQTPTITAGELAMALGISSRTVEKQLAKLKVSGRIQREGSDKGGRWIVLDEGGTAPQTTALVEPQPHEAGSGKADHGTEHVTDHGTEHVTDHGTEHVTEHVTEYVGRLVETLDGEMSRADLMAALEIKHREHFSDTYLRPALKSGLVEMTHPDKPKSVLQRYRLTEAGKRWVANHTSS